MFCGYCGKQIKDEAMFCPYCGAKVIQTGREREDDAWNNQKQGGDSRKSVITSVGSFLKEKIVSWEDLIPIIACGEMAALVIILVFVVRISNNPIPSQIVLDDYNSETYTFSNLEDFQYIDAFDGVSVEFSGTSPNITASLSVDGSLEDQWKYTLDKTSGLANGDTVTVTIDAASANAYMLKYGEYPEKLRKDYVVESFSYYVSSLDEIPEDALSKMNSEAEDSMMSTVSTFWATYRNHTTFESMDLLGYYFLVPKARVSTSYKNIIDLVYKVNINQYGSELSFYWYAGFVDGGILESGTYSMDYKIVSKPNDYGDLGCSPPVYLTSENGYQNYYAGYANIDDLFNDVVTANADKYTYESTVPGTSSGASTSSAISNSGDSADAEQTGEDESGDYLCSFSSDRLITDADLAAIRSSDYGSLPAGRSLEQMIVNEIYAKHGYKFSTPEIQAYFGQKDWYTALGSYQSDMDIIAGQLSSIEKQNVDFLESK